MPSPRSQLLSAGLAYWGRRASGLHDNGRDGGESSPMEMEYGDGGRRGKFVIVIGVLLALIAGATSWYLINQAQQSAGQGNLKKVSVVVAAKDISARVPVVPDDVALREIPLDAVSQNGTLL